MPRAKFFSGPVPHYLNPRLSIYSEASVEAADLFYIFFNQHPPSSTSLPDEREFGIHFTEGGNTNTILPRALRLVNPTLYRGLSGLGNVNTWNRNAVCQEGEGLFLNRSISSSVQ